MVVCFGSRRRSRSLGAGMVSAGDALDGRFENRDRTYSALSNWSISAILIERLLMVWLLVGGEVAWSLKWRGVEGLMFENCPSRRELTPIVC